MTICAEKMKKIIVAVDPQHWYSNEANTMSMGSGLKLLCFHQVPISNGFR